MSTLSEAVKRRLDRLKEKHKSLNPKYKDLVNDFCDELEYIVHIFERKRKTDEQAFARHDNQTNKSDVSTRPRTKER